MTQLSPKPAFTIAHGPERLLNDTPACQPIQDSSGIAMAPKEGGPLVALFRQDWQGMRRDAILAQGLDLVRGRNTENGFMPDLAIMHLAGFGCEIRADILGRGLNMLAQGLERIAQAFFTLGQQRHRCDRR